MIEFNDKNYMIFNDDCIKLLKTFPNDFCNSAFTSPPYNRKRNDKYQFYVDNIDDYFNFLCEFTDQLMRICKKYIIINIQKTFYNKIDVYKYIGKYAEKIKDIIIWEKSNPMPAGGHNITNAYEFFIIISNEELKSNFTYTKNHITTSVNSNMPKEHKAVMKQEVSDWFITNFTKEYEIIIDPFMGVGTTGISCLNNNRKFIGIEIDKNYYEMSQINLENREISKLTEKFYTKEDLF